MEVSINEVEQARLERLLLLTRAQAMADRNDLRRLGAAYSHRDALGTRLQVAEDVIDQCNYFLNRIRGNER